MTLDESMAHVRLQLAHHRALKDLFDGFVGNVFGLIDAELPLQPKEADDGSLGFQLLGRVLRVTFSPVYDGAGQLRGAIRICHIDGEKCAYVPIGMIFFDLQGNHGDSVDSLGEANSFRGRPDRVRRIFLDWLVRFLASDEFRVAGLVVRPASTQ